MDYRAKLRSRARRIDYSCTPLYTFTRFAREVAMKLSISEARRRLPELIRRVRRDGGECVQITVHDEVVAELRAAQPEIAPGAAAEKLLELMAKLPRHRGRKTRISSHVKAHLYGRVGRSR